MNHNFINHLQSMTEVIQIPTQYIHDVQEDFICLIIGYPFDKLIMVPSG